MDAIGPAGNREVSATDPRFEVSWVRVPALGAEVDAMADIVCAFDALAAAQGACVTDPALDPGIDAPTPRVAGPGVASFAAGGSTAFGSRSQLNREPNGKCCTTGNFDSTSALYILIMP